MRRFKEGNTQMFIRRASAKDYFVVAKMITLLLSEVGGTPVKEESFISISKEFLTTKSNHFSAFLAYTDTDSTRCVGMLTVTEVSALYAGGSFGVIQEFYVIPMERSKGIGHQLLKNVIDYGHQRKWKRFEVGAPSLQKWSRTVDFYRREGFEEIGPRLKLML